MWTDMFVNILKYGQEVKGWDVGLMCNDGKKKKLLSEIFDLGAKQYLPPDLSNEEHDEEFENGKLKDIIKECENASGMSIGRIMLNGEREIGRAYLQIYYPNTRLGRVCLSDNSYPEKAIYRLFRYVIKVFDDFRPDLIISTRYAAPVIFAASLYSIRSNIPHVVLQYSKMQKDRFFWTNDFLMYNTFAKSAFNKKLKNNTNVSNESYNYIAEYRKKPEIANFYVANLFKRMSQGNWLNKYKGYYSAFLNNQNVLNKIYREYRGYFIDCVNKKYMKSYECDDLKKIKYIYFPFHKEPELMLNLKAPLWHNTSHTIKYISSMLPIGYKLIVREHIRNLGRKYPRDYRYLSSLPGVIIISPFDSQFKYIQNADLVITDNGSTGWEALLLRKPVITLERTFYDASNLSIKATKPSELDRYILKALNGDNKFNNEEYDRRLGYFLDVEKENSLSMGSTAEDHLQMIEKLLNKKFTNKENYILEEHDIR
jgi:hypothetical protein